MSVSIINNQTETVVEVFLDVVELTMTEYAKYHAESFFEEITRFDVSVENQRSAPGEYPYRDEGNLSELTDFGYDPVTRQSIFGVLDSGGSVVSEGLEPHEYIVRLEDELNRKGLAASFDEHRLDAETWIRRIIPIR